MTNQQASNPPISTILCRHCLRMPPPSDDDTLAWTRCHRSHYHPLRYLSASPAFRLSSLHLFHPYSLLMSFVRLSLTTLLLLPLVPADAAKSQIPIYPAKELDIPPLGLGLWNSKDRDASKPSEISHPRDSSQFTGHPRCGVRVQGRLHPLRLRSGLL